MAHDPLDLEAQQKAQNETRERAALAAKTEDEDVRWLMSSKRGRRIAHRWLVRAGVWQLSFNTNALTMAFNEGRRNEGLALTAKLMVLCPEHYTTLLKENTDV